MAENVKVAVRVRPFTAREQQLNSQLIVRMPNLRQTELKNPAEPQEIKKFNFDYSYWSHDGYRMREDGYMEPTDPSFVDQRKIFEDLGKSVLENAWRGYNCCLFAYGQTGSGKSFSVVGYGANKGLVPMVCEDLFSTIAQKKQQAKSGEEFQVSVSMMQIYNEQVNDLLDYRSKEPLKVRQHPNKGFYVEKLGSFPVRDYKEIQAKLDEGLKSRSVASTDMNATSSRAHTIFAVTFSQKIVASGVTSLRSSTINLVDLAGSERLSKTNATGDRLKEGVNINLSLSTLGNCIKALVDLTSGKNVVVPYRDSVLTMLLKNALEGNSKTIMIAALSPADVNYEETLSTLRFADRMKSIKTSPTVNESAADKLVRELKDENARLQVLLQAKSSGGIPRQALEELIRKNQVEMDNMRRTWEDRLLQAQRETELARTTDRSKQEMEERKMRYPHFWNLNEDPALTGLIVHFVDKQSAVIGNGKREPPADIIMNGLGILYDHAIIQMNKATEVSVTPGKHSRILVNGNTIRQPTVLHHNDRVMFGMTNLYVFNNPVEYEKLLLAGTLSNPFNFEEAQNEIHTKQSGLDNLSAAALQSSEDPRDSILLRERLILVMTNIHEANYMSNELRKGILYEPYIIPSMIRGGPQSKGLPEVCCKVTNLKTRVEFIWDSEKLANRKFMMQEVYAEYAAGLSAWNPPLEKDPFFDLADTEQLVGVAHVCLQPLAFLVEIEGPQTIIDTGVHRLGLIDVQIHPCDSNGAQLSQEDFLEDAQQLIDAQLHLRVRIGKARGIPERFNSTRVVVRLCDAAQPFASYEILKSVNVDYNYEFFWKAERVSESLLHSLLNDFAVIEIHGKQRDYRGTAQTFNSADELRIQPRQDMRFDQTDETAGEEPIRHAAELKIMQRRAENAELKLKQLKEFIDKTKDSGSNSVGIDEIYNLVFRKKGRGAIRATQAAMRLQKRGGDD